MIVMIMITIIVIIITRHPQQEHTDRQRDKQTDTQTKNKSHSAILPVAARPRYLPGITRDFNVADASPFTELIGRRWYYGITLKRHAKEPYC